ncbi:LppU/SCO3897 family protein [Catellatospora vulcania]|uniref:LppU/SCO3897 family protein n=1 Tax=Catellatospora vulcania TaxID=1460450 RepID=UPI0012D3AFB9|nr:hypothetical protein [Catellatospora vulcania]
MYQQPGPQAPISYYGVPAEPPRKTGKIIAIVVAAVVLLCCCGGGLVLALRPDSVAGFFKGLVDAVNSDVSNAEVGDCVNDATNVDDVKIVDCASADAARRVAGVLENQTEAQYHADGMCDEFPATEYVIWIGRGGGRGAVWCLEPIKK